MIQISYSLYHIFFFLVLDVRNEKEETQVSTVLKNVEVSICRYDLFEIYRLCMKMSYEFESHLFCLLYNTTYNRLCVFESCIVLWLLINKINKIITIICVYRDRVKIVLNFKGIHIF